MGKKNPWDFEEDGVALEFDILMLGPIFLVILVQSFEGVLRNFVARE